MPWPIVHNGKILVRNGKIATSLACCCGEVCPSYCICGCRWAVDSDFCQIANQQDIDDPVYPFGNWLPGPVTVTGFEFTIVSRNANNWDADLFACGTGLDTVIMRQSGPSRYYCKSTTDIERCCPVPDFLLVPIDEIIGSCSFPGGLILTPNRSNDCTPPLRLLAQSVLSTGGGWTNDFGLGITGCSTISASGVMSDVEAGGSGPDPADWTLEATLTNLSPCEEEDAFPDGITPTY